MEYSADSAMRRFQGGLSMARKLPMATGMVMYIIAVKIGTRTDDT
jgi:hypothetical protein